MDDCPVCRPEKVIINAYLGIDVDYEVLGEGGGMLIVTASGTAEVIE